MSLKSLYNWITKPIQNHYTLGEALLGHGFGRFNMKQGERVLERTLTGAGLVVGALTLATGGAAAIPLALGYAVGGKALGLIGAGVTRFMTTPNLKPPGNH